jgi:hypothetical protein
VIQWGEIIVPSSEEFIITAELFLFVTSFWLILSLFVRYFEASSYRFRQFFFNRNLKIIESQIRQKPGNFEGILMIFSVFEGFALSRLPIADWKAIDLID